MLGSLENVILFAPGAQIAGRGYLVCKGESGDRSITGILVAELPEPRNPSASGRTILVTSISTPYILPYRIGDSSQLEFVSESIEKVYQ